MTADFDVIVIGAGPGGEVAVGRLAAAGKRVALVERELIGGECGYWACVPSKTLLRPTEVRSEAEGAAGVGTPALDWPALREYRDTMVRHLDDSAQADAYRQQGVTVVRGSARLTGRGPWRVGVDGDGGRQELSAPHVLLATGSNPLVPRVEGLAGIGAWTNREATGLTEIPASVAVVGGSAVGVEMGQFLARMGSRVTIVQRGPRLMAREEPRVGELVADRLRRDGITLRLDAQARSARREGADCVLELDDGGEPLRTEVVLLATGRSPRTAGLGLEELGVRLGHAGELTVDAHCRVTRDGLWAVGDVTGVALFTHVAQYQGRVAADSLLGRPRTADYTGVPRVVFAEPEIACVGLTAEQARRRGVDVAEVEVDLAAGLARPWTYATQPEGHLGLVADRSRRVLLGAWAVAPQAGEWIHTAALAVRADVPLATLLDGIPQFPTFSQGFLQALEQLPV